MKNKIKTMFKSALNWLRFQWCMFQASRRLAQKRAEFPGCEDAMNTWPTTGSGTTGVIISGITTIRWGTTGLLQSPKPSGNFYVVTRYSQHTLSTNDKLPNGDGLTSTRVLTVDGQQWDLTVRDDTAMTPPQVGDSVTIVDGGGLIAGTTAGAIKTYTATVVDSGAEGAPKTAFERVITVENLILVESQTGSDQVAP